MEAEQLPVPVREFMDCLRDLLARLDVTGGWCAVFWRRDPDGMRACLDGREVPPWDVMESLLQDLAAAYGSAVAVSETARVRALHAAALAAHDARPGAREALRDRLDVMLREQRYAAERRARLTRRLACAATREESDAVALDLAWAEDDHRRAAARCAELTVRATALARHGAPPDGPLPAPRSAASYDPGHAPPGVRQRTGVPRTRHSGTVRRAAPAPTTDLPPAPEPAPATHLPPAPAPATAPGPEPATTREPEQSAPASAPEQPASAVPATPTAPTPSRPRPRRRRGGARFAGVEEADVAAVVVPAASAPEVPVARGARFAGAAGAVGEEREERAEVHADPVDRQEAARIVGVLGRLRSQGRSGEAHALLTEAAHGPAARYPLLADELRRARLDADWATLLWEAASLPAGRLVAAADALTAAGLTDDAEQVLRHGVVRPADEIGRAVLALTAEDRHREARALLDACVRTRTPEDTARTAAPDPQRLVPLLLAAARHVSDERHWDLLHALRVAGLTV
ncbi:hypothetical protein RKD26_000946 [Streptomyces calvus]|uniref:hypothetical protein n=1 Tax=Streptomyces calvus TaxID=67282 RepID=UPI0035155D5C